MSADLAAARFRRDCEAVWSLGPRVLAELLSEIGAERMAATYIEATVSRYAAIDPTALAILGGDTFPAGPMRAIGT